MRRGLVLGLVALDPVSTAVGVFLLGYRELGRVPATLFEALGPLGLLVLYAYEALLALTIYAVASRWLGELAIPIAVGGPWTVGWRNIGVLLAGA